MQVAFSVPGVRFDLLVRSLRANQALFSRFTLCLLGLAFCVFTWGLEYKLSLYEPPQASSHEIPSAKLLSKDEQSATATSPLLEKGGVSVTAVVVTTLFTLFLSFVLAVGLRDDIVPAWSGEDARLVRRRRTRSCLNAFFFRPPPVPACV